MRTPPDRPALAAPELLRGALDPRGAPRCGSGAGFPGPARRQSDQIRATGRPALAAPELLRGGRRSAKDTALQLQRREGPTGRAPI